jgi:DNA-directed RNA polymerase specialized sigma24 family protein
MVSVSSGQGIVGTPTARTTGSALTADRLGEAWPEVSTRLKRMLGSRGVDPTLAEDIVQDVALRALDKQVPFTDPDDLYRWAATTARHLHIDHLRTGGRTTGDELLVAVPDHTDVAHAAERRVALGQVWRALAVMRPREREAILDSLHEREARSSQVLVRRHRARASLRKAVGGVLVWVTAARLRAREWAPALQNASAAVVLTPALAVGTAGLFAAEAPQPAPVVVRTERVAETGPGPGPVVRSDRVGPAPAAPRRAVQAPAPDAPREEERPQSTELAPGLTIEDEPSPPPDVLVCVENSSFLPMQCVPDPL